MRDEDGKTGTGMNVIRFPTVGVKRNTPSRLSVGFVSFTCPECNEAMSADFKKMVFKSVEMFCGQCGTGYRMTNPAFNVTKPVKK